MTADAPTNAPGRWFHIWNRPYVLALLIYAIIKTIQASRLVNSEWTQVYVQAARRLVSGQSIYPPGTPFVYPPFSAFIAVPFVWMPDGLGQSLISALNVAALGIILTISWRLADGRHPLELRPFRLKDHLIAILAALCTLRLAFNTIDHQQTDLIIAALMLIGCARFAQGKSLSAAVFWGLGAAFKATPLVFCGYLIWRGRWTALLVMLATVTAANLLPDLIHRGEGGQPWAAQWFQTYVAPLAQADHKTGDWNASLLDNQSLAGFAGRVLLHDYTVAKDGLDLFNRPSSIGPHATKMLVYAAYLLLAIVSAIVMWPPFRRTNPVVETRGFGHRNVEDKSDAKAPPYQDGVSSAYSAYALEFSIVFMAILLISPMSSRAHFCTLILPAMLLARAAIDHASRVACVTLLIATALLLLSTNNPFIRQWNRITLYWGFVTLATIALLIGCFWLRRKIKSPEARPSGSV